MQFIYHQGYKSVCFILEKSIENICFYKHKNTTFFQNFTNEHFVCKSLIFCFLDLHSHCCCFFQYSLMVILFKLKQQPLLKIKSSLHLFFCILMFDLLNTRLYFYFSTYPYTLNNKLYGGLSQLIWYLCSVYCIGSVFFIGESMMLPYF